MIIDIRHSFISSAGCHHVERISCKISDIWKLQRLVTIGECLCVKPEARMRPSKLFIIVVCTILYISFKI